MIGIYRLISPTNKIYVGQSWNIEKRKKRYQLVNCKGQPKLYTSLKKYGFENHSFKILYQTDVPDQKILNYFEDYYIEQYRSMGYEMLNIRKGGSNGKLSEETKQKLRKPKSVKSFWLGRKHSPEAKLKMSLSKKGKQTKSTLGKKMSEETKLKIKQTKEWKKSLITKD